MKDVKEIKIEIDGQGILCDVVNPARVIVRPMAKLENARPALDSIRGVAGVLGVEQEYNDLVVFADLSLLSLDALKAAVDGGGVKCQIASHEEVTVRFETAGSIPALKDDLARTKWVLNVAIDVEKKEVKTLCVKGRLTRAIVSGVMSKHGFKELK